MKIHFALLCVVCLQTLLLAQVNPAASSQADKVELMLRRLREAMTNPPAATTPERSSVPVLSPAAVQPKPQPSASSQFSPAAAPAAAPSVAPAVQPSAVPAQLPGATQPGTSVVPRTNVEAPSTAGPATVPPSVAPVQLPGSVQPGTSAVSRTNVAAPSTAQSPATVALPGATQPSTAPPMSAPRARPSPIRGSAAVPPRPGVNPAGTAAPGPAVNLPGMPAPGAAEVTTAPAAPRTPVTVSSAFDPNEIIVAGTIQVQEMDPAQFFDSVYAPISGRTVIRGANLQGLQKITLKAATDWTRQEAVFAMDAVMAQNNIAMIPIGDKFVKAVPMQQAAQEGAEPSNVEPGDYAAAEPFITQVIQLKVVQPSELQQLLSTFTKSPQGITAFDATQTLVIRDYASNVKRMMEVIKKVDVPEREPDYHLEAIPIKYGKVIDLYNTMEALISGSGVPASSTAAAAGMQGTMGYQQRGRFGGSASPYGMSSSGYNRYGGGFGSRVGGGYSGYGGGSMYPYEESVERMTALQATTPQPTTSRTSVGAAQSSFQNRLNQIVRRAASGDQEEVQVLENARIVPDERSNKLLVFANRRDMEMITNIVTKVDVLLAQVLIEAVIMEVRLGDSVNLGFNWVQRPKQFGDDFAGAGLINNGQGFLNSITNFPNGLAQGFTYFGTVNDQWDVAIRAVAEDSSINVVSRPRIQTSHAIPGSFFVGETVPYITGFTDYGGLGVTGVATRSVVQQANVGFSLFVTPFITPDGLVVMEISQEFSTRGRDVLIDDNPIPIINGRNADSTLTVRDGDTIMMGGFITENQSRAKSGVPFLKDIPGLGALFRSKNNSNDRNELIVLMRARVLRTPEDAALVATQERSELPGVHQAEQDLKRANDKRRERSTRQK